MVFIIPLVSILTDKLVYLDPGSGSFLIQLAIAALVGLAVVFRSQWTKIKKMFGGKTKSEDDETEDDEQQ